MAMIEWKLVCAAACRVMPKGYDLDFFFPANISILPKYLIHPDLFGYFFDNIGNKAIIWTDE